MTASKTSMDRDLEYWPPGAAHPVPVRVRIGLPEPHPDYEWECQLTIEGFPRTPHYSKGMNGADPLDALYWALAIAPLHLRLMTDRGGRLTWKGGEDLRFPSMFAEPKQDRQWTPSGGGEPRKLAMRVGLPERIDDQWSALVTCMDCTTWQTTERRVAAGTWPEVLKLAAEAVPLLLRDYTGTLGEGTLEEEYPSPSCGISGAKEKTADDQGEKK